MQLSAITPAISYKLINMIGLTIYTGKIFYTENIAIPMTNLKPCIYYLTINNTTQKVEVLNK